MLDRNTPVKNKYSPQCLATIEAVEKAREMRRIKEYRQRRGMTQEQLADAAGVRQAYISRLERGLQEPSLDTLKAIAGALSIPPGDLMERDALEERIRRALDALDQPQKEAAAAVLEAFAKQR